LKRKSLASSNGEKSKSSPQKSAGAIEVIQDHMESLRRYKDLLLSSSKEIIIYFPTANSFFRQKKAGIIDILTTKATSRRKTPVIVRLLVPAQKKIMLWILKLAQETKNIDFHFISPSVQGANATIAIVDKTTSVMVEIRDDFQLSWGKAIGLSIFSTSEAGVRSYVSIFDNLWLQTELYEQIKESNKQLESANEQLKIHGRMQKEFVNIAAHELRTPIMPILGAVDLMESKLSEAVMGVIKGEIDIIMRNTRRLQRLSEELLQISKIESGNFKLQKEKVNLCQLAIDNINDVRIKYAEKSERVAIDLVCDNSVIEAECDPVRIGEVMFNLLDNAMKFMKDGTITVHIQDMNRSGWFVVKITDTGPGISSDVADIMFDKFITTSSTGAGIGLYLCMKIIEAHGGYISGQNRKNRNGAVFTFAIPSDHNGGNKQDLPTPGFPIQLA